MKVRPWDAVLQVVGDLDVLLLELGAAERRDRDGTLQQFLFAAATVTTPSETWSLPAPRPAAGADWAQASAAKAKGPPRRSRRALGA